MKNEKFGMGKMVWSESGEMYTGTFAKGLPSGYGEYVWYGGSLIPQKSNHAQFFMHNRSGVPSCPPHPSLTLLPRAPPPASWIWAKPATAPLTRLQVCRAICRRPARWGGDVLLLHRRPL